MLKIFFESLINLIRFINLSYEKKEFVFYSESKFYREHFIDLILNLKKKGQKNIVLITSDRDDLLFYKEILPEIDSKSLGTFFLTSVLPFVVSAIFIFFFLA